MSSPDQETGRVLSFFTRVSLHCRISAGFTTLALISGTGGVVRRTLLALLIGLGLGALGGAVFGWLIPVQDVSAGIDKLHPTYKADYTVMVGAAYANNGDWDLAQLRLGYLAEPDPAAYIVVLAEQYIAEGRDPNDIRNLVRLAARLGYTTPPMQLYIPPTATP
jgi:hypothetical protein